MLLGCSECTTPPVTIYFDLDFLVEQNAKGFLYSLIAAIIFNTCFSPSIIDFLLNSFSFLVFLCSTNIFHVRTNCSSQLCCHCPFFNGVVILRYTNCPIFCLGISIYTSTQRKYNLFKKYENSL